MVRKSAEPSSQAKSSVRAKLSNRAQPGDADRSRATERSRAKTNKTPRREPGEAEQNPCLARGRSSPVVARCLASSREVARCPDFDSRLCHPLLYLEALEQAALKKVAYYESFASTLDFQFPRTPGDNTAARCVVQQPCVSGAAVNCALPACARLTCKSSRTTTDLQEFTDNCVASSAQAAKPQDIKDCLVTDGTKKGLENLLLRKRKCLLSSSGPAFASTVFAT